VQVGSGATTYIQLLETKPNFKLLNGVYKIISCIKQSSQSFLDYVLNGFNISLCIGIDFTLSNIEPHKPNSLHYYNNGGICVIRL
jgi:hypothetical protein